MAAPTNKIKVAIRLRPFNKRELSLAANPRSIVEMTKTQTILQNPEEAERQPKSFTFDHCFHSMDPKSPDFATQSDVFKSVGNTRTPVKLLVGACFPARESRVNMRCNG